MRRSRFFIQSLPPYAIKMLITNADGIEILPFSYPDDAFGLLGADELAKKTVFVEDRLSVEIVKRLIKLAHPTLVEAIDVRAISGGAETIISRYIYPYAQTAKKDVIFLLDGDKDYRNKISQQQELRTKIMGYFDSDHKFDLNRIPDADNQILEGVFQEITGVSSKKVLCTDGSNGTGNLQQKYSQIRIFLSYWFARVRFLNSLTPEQAVIESLPETYRKELCLGQPYVATTSGKGVFEAFTRKDLDVEIASGEDIFMTQKRYIARLSKDCPLLKSVEEALQILLE